MGLQGDMGISIEVIGIFIGVCEAKGPGTLFCCIDHRYTQRLAHAVVCLVGIMFVGRQYSGERVMAFDPTVHIVQ